MLPVSPYPDVLNDMPHMIVIPSRPLLSASEDLSGHLLSGRHFKVTKKQQKIKVLLAIEITRHSSRTACLVHFIRFSHTHCKIAHFLSVTPGCQTICVGIQFWALFKIHGVEGGVHRTLSVDIFQKTF